MLDQNKILISENMSSMIILKRINLDLIIIQVKGEIIIYRAYSLRFLYIKGEKVRSDNMRKYIAICVVLLIVVNYTGCFEKDVIEGGKTSKDSLTIAMSDRYFGFYPWIDSYDVNTLNINHNIFSALVEFDSIFQIKPELALSWSTPDNLTWRFYLRENVKFHNGYDFTAEDVKYSIDLVKEDNTSVLRDLLESVKEVVIVDDYIVDIITVKPSPILLNKLVDIPIVSKKYQEETTEKWPIGTGAFKLVEYDCENFTKLELFESYWDDEVEVKNVTFEIIQDDVERKNAIINRTVDIAEHILPRFYEEISNNIGIEARICVQPTVFFLSFDFRENDSVAFEDGQNPLTDINVRKAIYHAINATYIIDTVLNGSDFAEPASQFVSPLIFGYNPDITRLSYDPDKAKELMKKAGYENGFELVLYSSKDFCTDIQICQILQTQLSEIIDVKLNFTSTEGYFTNLMNRNCSFYTLGWLAATGDGGEIFDYMLRTVDKEAGIGTYNLGYYSNPEVDRIGENVSYIIDPQKRLELMQEGFRIAMEDLAWIPLYVPKCVYGVADDVAWDPRSDMMMEVKDIGFK